MRDGCLNPLGMSTGDIRDFQLSSSSQFRQTKEGSQASNGTASCKTDCYQLASYGPERARYGLDRDKRGYGAWRPNKSDMQPWIGVDFRQKVQINAIVVEQFEMSFLSTFTLTESDDYTVWYNYTVGASLYKHSTQSSSTNYVQIIYSHLFHIWTVR